MSPRRPAPLTVLLVVALFGAGALVSGFSLIDYRHAWWLGGVMLPWGLVLSLAAAYACARAAGLVGSTAGAIAFAAGWAAVLLATYAPRPEGDYLVAADLRGYAYLAGGLLLVGFAVVRTAAAAPARHPQDPPPRLRR